MVLSHDEFLNAVNARVGDSATDDDLTFLENMTDTLNDLETRANADTVEQLRAENEALRKKYRDRFMTGSAGETENIPGEESEETDDYSYSNLWED